MEKDRILEIKYTYLELIINIAEDYDGYDTVEGLKGLVDELADLASKAYHNDDTSAIYETIGDKKLNILMEEI